MKIETALTYDDIMMVPRHSNVNSRKQPDTTSFVGKTKLSIPIIAAPMNTVTESRMAKTMREIGADAVIHRYLSIDVQCDQFAEVRSLQPWVAVGASGDFLERAMALYAAGARKFCIDVANGHSQICVDAVKALRSRYKECEIMAGNICTSDGAKNLVLAGANVVRVGIGPGSMCTTRLVTGFGVPQVTAIMDIAEFRRHNANIDSKHAKMVSNFTMVADGGIRHPGDIVKALALGADAVMIGGLLAGTDQTPGETHTDIDTGLLYKHYHGMASVEGRKGHYSDEATSYVPEGSSTKAHHRGDAAMIVTKLNNSLRTGMSFNDALNLEEHRKNARLVRVTENGRVEGTPNRKLFK